MKPEGEIPGEQGSIGDERVTGIPGGLQNSLARNGSGMSLRRDVEVAIVNPERARRREGYAASVVREGDAAGPKVGARSDRGAHGVYDDRPSVNPDHFLLRRVHLQRYQHARARGIARQGAHTDDPIEHGARLADQPQRVEVEALRVQGTDRPVAKEDPIRSYELGITAAG